MSKWEMVRLGEVCTKAGSSIAQKNLEHNIGNYPIFGASGLIKNVDFYKQENEYVAIVKDGAGIGRATSLPAKSSIIGTMQYILPKNNIDIKYLYYVITNMKLARYFSGATIPHIYFKDYEKEKLPLPPIEEQRKIADTLDKASDIIMLYKEQLAELNNLIKSVFYDMFGDPVTNERGWEKSKISSFAQIATGSTPNRSNLEYYNGNIPWIKTGEISQGYIVKPEENITEKAISETNCKIFPVNTILIAMYGQGKTRGLAGLCKIETTTNQACAAILPTNDYNSEFLFRQLSVLYTELRVLGRGGNQENLNLSIIKNFHCITPPLPLQTKFATIVTKIEQQKTELQTALNDAQMLFDSLMQEYFE